jgi:cytochrome P450
VTGRDDVTGRPEVAFDHKSRAHGDGVAAYASLRGSCPVAWTSANGGHWVVTTHAAVTEVLQRAGDFCSANRTDPDGTEWGGLRIPRREFYRLLPGEADQPEWNEYRRLVGSWFTPAAIGRRRAAIGAIVDDVLDSVIERGEADLVSDIAGPIVASATLDLLGFDRAPARQYAHVAHLVAYASGTELEGELGTGMEWMKHQIEGEIALRMSAPTDDFTSAVVHGSINDRPPTREEAVAILLQVLLGGLDTTSSLITYAMSYLSEHREDLDRLRDDDHFRRTATEEFVRWVSPIGAMARSAAVDVTLADQAIERRAPVLVAFKSANRDDAVFADADSVRLDRAPNPHVGFGAGVHRCLGSHAARAVFQETLVRILTRMPDFRIDMHRAERYPYEGTAVGYVAMPMSFTAGPRLPT